MKEKIVEKEQLKEWLQGLCQDYQVWAPTEEDGQVLFSAIESVSEISLGFSNTDKTPKDIFFPQREVLFSFQGEQIEDLSAGTNGKPRVIFAIRPCDTRGLNLLDKVFDSEDYQDPYYIQKRRDTFLVGMACTHPRATCFCTSVESGPFDKTGVDLFVSDLGDERYFLEAVTERGKTLLNGGGSFSNIKEADRKKLEEVRHRSEAKIKSQISSQGLEGKLDNIFDSSLWSRIHEKCLGCAACTYLCPTCHCFALIDEKVDRRGERVRNWDSCMFPGFTAEASGHNPRVSNRERLRQRIMHKFNYFIKRFGQTGCVGCGRCIRNCPVNMDIREIIKEIGNE